MDEVTYTVLGGRIETVGELRKLLSQFSDEQKIVIDGLGRAASIKEIGKTTYDIMGREVDKCVLEVEWL